MILGLTGPLASGKGASAEYLETKGFLVFSLSDAIRIEARKRGIETTRDNMIALGNELRETHGPSVLAKKILEEVEKHPGEDIAIDSIRNTAEVQALKDAGVTLIGIDADPRKRFERLVQRGRAGDVQSFEELVAVEERENSTSGTGQQLLACYKLAEHYLNNNGDITDLQRQIDELLEKIGWRK